MSKIPIHPFQYLMIGIALTMFYTLLVSISEHSNFLKAYLIAGSSVIILITLYRQRSNGFSFEEVNYVMYPCFRNHVNYAAIMAVFLPFIVLGTRWYSWRNPLKWLLIFGACVFLLAIQLSYTRTAYISVFLAFGSYFLIRLTK